jgi:tetratricopeptide (TPR) repeat protein
MTIPHDVQSLLDDLHEIGVESDDLEKMHTILAEHYADDAQWIEIAADLRQQRNYQGAYLVYERMIARFPRSHRVWHNRGILFRAWWRLEEAIPCFEKALELQPDYALAMESLALTYELLRNYPNAITWYQKALELRPESTMSLNNLANCFRFSGQRQAAKHYLERTLAIDPDYQDALFNLAALLFEEKQFDAALQRIERLLTLVPRDEQAQKLRKAILNRPEQPPTFEPEKPREKTIIRASPNYGYTGTIADGKITVAKPEAEDEQSSDILSTEDVIRMDREQAASKVGYLAWDRAHLWQLVNEVVQTTPPPQEPTIFVSYRWESDAVIAWVSQFADDLVERGYDVVFDRHLQKDPQPPTVPELVSRVAHCNIFAPVLTEGYRRRVETGPHGHEDGWVFDEYQVALRLGNAGRVRFVGIWRSGPVVPAPFSPDNVCDFRNDNQYTALMDQVFPTRYAVVIGRRPDDTYRSIGPVKLSQTQGVIKMLQDTGEFTHILVKELERRQSE